MKTELAGRKAAEKFRQSYGLKAAPITDLVKTVEEITGCHVAFRDTPQPEHGMTIPVPHSDVEIIAVSLAPDFLWQREYLAHELGHWFFDKFQPHVSDDLLASETKADAFARHLLIPRAGVKQCLSDINTTSVLPALSQVVQNFLVLPQMALLALREVGFISERAKRDFNWVTAEHLAQQFGWADEYTRLQHDTDRRYTPQRLLGRAILELKEGEALGRIIATLKDFDIDAVELRLQGLRLGAKKNQMPLTKDDDYWLSILAH